MPKPFVVVTAGLLEPVGVAGRVQDSPPVAIGVTTLVLASCDWIHKPWFREA